MLNGRHSLVIDSTSSFANASLLSNKILTRKMGHNGQAAMQLMNGAQVKGTGSSNSNSRNTPFTVDEALPYSPFSSIVPFDSGTWLSRDYPRPKPK